MTADQSRRAINRYNARKSDRTDHFEGKERTRQNALKHGSERPPMGSPSPTRTPTTFQDQFDEWVEPHQPVGPAEFAALVEEIAVAQLRLRRCRTREAAVLELQVGAADEVWATKEVGRLELPDSPSSPPTPRPPSAT